MSFTLKLPEIDISIKSDKSKLESITTNLINNAIKFTENGSIEVGLQKNNDVILLYFKDTGCGIKPENIKSVFNRFSQEGLEFTRSYEGNGLGLAITKSYTEMIDAKIWVESAVDRGSTFFVELKAKISE